MSILGNISHVQGCIVSYQGQRFLVDYSDIDSNKICTFVSKGKSYHSELDNIKPGFLPGEMVKHVPELENTENLGIGRYITSRKILDRYLSAVYFEKIEEVRWVPYYRLRIFEDVVNRYLSGRLIEDENNHMYCRLKILAHMIDSWHEKTGSLGRLDIDPLPHQLNLVRHIMKSGHKSWMIADDVGLGKTIEVGLLLHAINKIHSNMRILICCPPSLTDQWQLELKAKFNLEFEIYGKDFNKSDNLDYWLKRSNVIVSMDKAKNDQDFKEFENAGRWNLVIFDEAHRLTKTENGKEALRYKLAKMLRKNTDDMLLLTATPHQGKSRQFQNLLKIVRPDLSKEIDHISDDSLMVGDIVLRNPKSKVTDINGNLIFKGHKTKRFEVPISEEMKVFSEKLEDYLSKGYGRSSLDSNSKERAIGFVMTTYRKLASSSIEAIQQSLTSRLNRLKGFVHTTIDDEFIEINDEIYSLDTHDYLSEEFFDHETEMLTELIDLAKSIKSHDEKARVFINDIVGPLLKEGKKILIFSEYRATQKYLEKLILDNFYDIVNIVKLNGSMRQSDKIESVNLFNNKDNYNIMLSTEAGGEGLNLQDSCHIMVNYDLPWNPSKIIQRIGRLYRYGQKETVLVINMRINDTFDNKSINMLWDKVEIVSKTLESVSSEYKTGVHNEILGEVMKHIDVESLLEEIRNFTLEQTDEELNKAIEKANELRKIENDLLSKASSFINDDSLIREVNISLDHLSFFVVNALKLLGCQVEGTYHDNKVFDIMLSDHLVGYFTDFSDNQKKIKITVYRDVCKKNIETKLIDFESDLLHKLMAIHLMRDSNLGTFDKVIGPNDGLLALKKVIWQNNTGKVILNESFIVSSNDSGYMLNPEWLLDYILNGYQLDDKSSYSTIDVRKNLLRSMDLSVNDILLSQSTEQKYPQHMDYISIIDMKI